MYRDKDKQRETGRERQRRYRDKHKPIPEVTPSGNIRVSKPSDADYEPQCETTKAFIEGRPKRLSTGKRGLDIKVFEDLPQDVQQSIDSMSVVEGKIDPIIKANRTAIAINYQHVVPGRFEPKHGQGHYTVFDK